MAFPSSPSNGDTYLRYGRYTANFTPPTKALGFSNAE